jgi:uncharacterized protein
MQMEASRAHWKGVRASNGYAFLLVSMQSNQLRSRYMSKTAVHHKINYIEFATTDVARAKQFYSKVFGWTFKDWGPDYIDSTPEAAGIALGFRRGDSTQTQPSFAPLVVLYSADLKATEDAIVAAGGSIVVPTFEFPGGRRFHFNDGVGNILAVWSE